MLKGVSFPQPLIDRFVSKLIVDWDTGCWLWTARIHPWGYGELNVKQNGKWQVIKAHRVAYALYRGKIPRGFEIDHLCRQRRCVNPYHLEATTKKVNLLRGMSPPAQNLRKTCCPYGHPYSGDNLRISKPGHRKCRACERITHRLAYRIRAHPTFCVNAYAHGLSVPMLIEALIT